VECVPVESRLIQLERAGATHCGTVSILISWPTNRTPDGCQLHRWSVLVGPPTHTSQRRDDRNERGGNCRDEGLTEMDRQTDRRRASTTTGVDVSADREPTAAEVLEWRRDDVVFPEAQATTEEFPSLRNISAGFIFGGVVRRSNRLRRST
jgi:hypothetical protein